MVYTFDTESSKFAAAAWRRNSGGLGLRPTKLTDDTPNDLIRVAKTGTCRTRRRIQTQADNSQTSTKGLSESESLASFGAE